MSCEQKIETFPPVVVVNVGGTRFTTALSTLCRLPDSFLGAMFSGRHPILRDIDGNPFIDFEPEHFRHVLQFLRMQTLPPVEASLEVYEAASYFGIEPLREQLASLAPVAKALVKAAYRDRYKSLRQFIIKRAVEKATAGASHQSVVRIAFGDWSRQPGHGDYDICFRELADKYLDEMLPPSNVQGENVNANVMSDGYTPAMQARDDAILRCVRVQLVEDGYVLLAGNTREMCSGCELWVEKFEFNFSL